MPQRTNLKVSYSYINWLLITNRAIMGHLYQFTSVTGENDYFTDMDTDITYNGNTWKSGSLRFEGLQRKISIGLDVDQQTIKIWAAPTDTLFGAAFLANAEQGILDGCVITRMRIVWAFSSGNAAADIQQAPLAVWPLFTGYTGKILKGGASHIELNVSSGLHKLAINMPRNYYQPGCLWTLFDPGCTLLKSDFLSGGTVGAGVTYHTIPVAGGVATPTGGDDLPSYAQGLLLFTSGVNDGLQVLVNTNDSANLYLAYVLDELPGVGDTFDYFPGCSKSYNTCGAKFGNTANFRGFDKVPPVVVSV